MNARWVAVACLLVACKKTSAASDAGEKVARAGDLLTFEDDSQWVVENAEDLGSEITPKSGGARRTTSGHFLLVRFSVTNLDPQPAHLLAAPRVVAEGGRVLGAVENASAFLLPRDKTPGGQTLPSSQPRSFALLIEVPKGAKDVVLEATPLSLGRKGERKLVHLE